MDLTWWENLSTWEYLGIFSNSIWESSSVGFGADEICASHACVHFYELHLTAIIIRSYQFLLFNYYDYVYFGYFRFQDTACMVSLPTFEGHFIMSELSWTLTHLGSGAPNGVP